MATPTKQLRVGDVAQSTYKSTYYVLLVSDPDERSEAQFVAWVDGRVSCHTTHLGTAATWNILHRLR